MPDLPEISDEMVDAAALVLRSSVKRHGAHIGTETAERWARDILAAALVASGYRPEADVLREVAAERERQDAKWGEQNHPLVDQVLVGRPHQRMAEEYEIPTAMRAQFLCQAAARRGEVTWAHIIVEELSEFVCTEPTDIAAMREELIQVAASAVAAVECIDRQESDRG